jgi:multiple sugar transport system permease protein/raffinose/stachyose/melibiose transport system permease protein
MKCRDLKGINVKLVPFKNTCSRRKYFFRGDQMKGKLKRNIQFQLFLVPAFIFYFAFVILPMIMSFAYSFTGLTFTKPEYHFIGLENYTKLFADEVVTNSLSYTMIYTIGTTILITLCCVPLALLLDTQFSGRNMYRAVFYFPSCIGAFIFGYVFRYLLSSDDLGFLNMLLIKLFGIEAIPFLSEIFWARLCTILVCVWMATGWNATIYLAYLQSIPEELYESARIDGANTVQRVRYITLPLLTPAAKISIMTLLTGGLRVFELPFALTNGGPARSTSSITQALIIRGITEGNIGYACSLGIVFLVLILVVTLVETQGMSKLEERVS